MLQVDSYHKNDEVNVATYIGATRKENQDNYYYATATQGGNSYTLAVVCDGMGGLENGQEASKTAILAIREYMGVGFTPDNLVEALKGANEAVGMLEGAGTTCTALLLNHTENKYFIAHVGDTRCYKWVASTGVIKLLTYDHTHYNKLVRSGDLGKLEGMSEGEVRKAKSTLTRCLGVRQQMLIDTYTGTFNPGDGFCLISDGAWHYLEGSRVNFTTISDISAYFQQVVGSGETDNMTMMVVKAR